MRYTPKEGHRKPRKETINVGEATTRLETSKPLEVSKVGNKALGSELAKAATKGAAIGAAVAIPVPVIGPVVGGVIGAGIGVYKNLSKKANIEEPKATMGLKEKIRQDIMHDLRLTEENVKEIKEEIRNDWWKFPLAMVGTLIFFCVAVYLLLAAILYGIGYL